MTYGLSTARSLDENSPHRFRGGTKEMRAALECGSFVADESQPGFVDESGGLECLARFLFRQAGGR